MNNVQETKINEEVTVLTDDLGLQREYREVRRKANVGEKVRIVKAAYDQFTTKIIDMLTSLSTKVTELEREVQTLKERQITVNMPEITVNTPVTTEEIAERVQKALEPLIGRPLAKTEDKPKQLTRSDVVAKAQADIIWLQAVTENGRPVYRLPIARLCTAEFIVNREKRTVVVLLRREIRKSEVVSKGIAKCAPEDVFNADIGKAIALRRALGLTVPSEYTDAPKPEGVAVGDVVSNWEGRRMIAVDEHGKGRPLNSLSVRYIKEQGYKVIDDSYRKEYRKGVRC